MANIGYIKCLNKQDLLEYLKNSGFGAVHEIIGRLDIDGQKFLEMNELELVKLKLSVKQRNAIMTCINQVKGRRPSIPKKPIVLKKSKLETVPKSDEYIDMTKQQRKNKLAPLRILQQSEYSEIDVASPTSPPDEYVDCDPELPRPPKVMWHPKPSPAKDDDTELYQVLGEEAYEEPAKLAHEIVDKVLPEEKCEPSIKYYKPAPVLPPRKPETTPTIALSVPYDGQLQNPTRPLGKAGAASIPSSNNLEKNVRKIDILPRPPKTTNVDSRHMDLMKSVRNDSQSRFSTKNSSTIKVSKFIRNVDRHGAQELLKRIPNLQDGAFVIRKSKKHFYVITIWHVKRFFNVTVDRLDDGHLYIKAENGAVTNTFETLDELVDYYKKHAFVIKKEDQNMTIYLKELLTDDIV